MLRAVTLYLFKFFAAVVRDKDGQFDGQPSIETKLTFN